MTKMAKGMISGKFRLNDLPNQIRSPVCSSMAWALQCHLLSVCTTLLGALRVANQGDKEIAMGKEDKVAGQAKQAKGKANEVAGAARGDTAQEIKGKVQKAVGEV